MDRLLEVNKVASLMRRCENPRGLTGVSKPEASTATQHGFYEPLMTGWLGGTNGLTSSIQIPALRLGARELFAPPVVPAGPPQGAKPAADSRQIAAPPQKGRALRVSATAAFRVRPPQVPPVTIHATIATGIQPSRQRQTPIAGVSLTGAEDPKPRLAALGRSIPTMCLPKDPEVRFSVLGAPNPQLKLNYRPAAAAGNPAMRMAAVRFTGHDGISAKES